jgi:hypothetical protein
LLLGQIALSASGRHIENGIGSQNTQEKIRLYLDIPLSAASAFISSAW